MLAILPAFDAAFEARESLRDVAQPSFDGSQASVQAGNLAPEEAPDREHGEGVDQHFHSSSVDAGSRYWQPRAEVWDAPDDKPRVAGLFLGLHSAVT